MWRIKNLGIEGETTSEMATRGNCTAMQRNSPGHLLGPWDNKHHSMQKDAKIKSFPPLVIPKNVENSSSIMH